ncbi:MAG: glycosyltransferase [bacterium]|nr:glycosyltransferase [bacterium]
MVSIIIPTLNEAQYLPRLLSSIRDQDYKDYEVIVADAGSTDGTREIARSCTVVQGGNPARGRNEGACVAKGDYLLFLDADVVLPKGFLSSLMQEVRDKNIGVAGCALVLDEQGVFFRLGEKLWNGYFWLTQHFYPHATNCFLVAKEVHERIQGFNERIHLGEEFDYVRRGASVSAFAFLMNPAFIASARRVKKEGLLRTFFLYIVAEVAMTLGIKITSPKFPYHFHTYEKKDHLS